MSKEVIKKGIINTLAASGGNLDTDSETGLSTICVLNSADPLVPIIPFSIKPRTVKSVSYITGAEEVSRVWTLGIEDTETIVASTKYTIEVDYAQYKRNSTRRGSDYKYGYTSPAVLTSAAVDRTNVYTALVSKINAHTGNFVRAALISELTVVAAGNLDEVAIGDKIFQTDSTYAAATWEATIAGWNTAGTVYYVYDQSGTLNDATVDSLYVVTATPEAVTTDAEAVEVAGQGLVIVDDAGYWITPDLNRPGASSVAVTNGFSNTTPNIITDATYAQGQGDVMLAQVPVYNFKADDIISGDIDMTFNEAPESAKSYTLAIIEIVDNPEASAGQNQYAGQTTYLHLYLDESNSSNLTNLKTPLTALVGL